jgi:hypothetical protein
MIGSVMKNPRRSEIVRHLSIIICGLFILSGFGGIGVRGEMRSHGAAFEALRAFPVPVLGLSIPRGGLLNGGTLVTTLCINNSG